MNNDRFCNHWQSVFHSRDAMNLWNGFPSLKKVGSTVFLCIPSQLSTDFIIPQHADLYLNPGLYVQPSFIFFFTFCRDKWLSFLCARCSYYHPVETDCTDPNQWWSLTGLSLSSFTTQILDGKSIQLPLLQMSDSSTLKYCCAWFVSFQWFLLFHCCSFIPLTLLIWCREKPSVHD